MFKTKSWYDGIHVWWFEKKSLKNIARSSGITHKLVPSSSQNCIPNQSTMDLEKYKLKINSKNRLEALTVWEQFLLLLLTISFEYLKIIRIKELPGQGISKPSKNECAYFCSVKHGLSGENCHFLESINWRNKHWST